MLAAAAKSTALMDECVAYCCLKNNLQWSAGFLPVATTHSEFCGTRLIKLKKIQMHFMRESRFLARRLQYYTGLYTLSCFNSTTS